MEESMRFSVFATVGLFLFLSCTSFADDCEFIREEIRKMPVAGGDILIPRGVFNCSKSIIVNKNHIRLRGAGQEQTILQLQSKAHVPLLIVGDHS
jgi:hypothetical protein